MVFTAGAWLFVLGYFGFQWADLFDDESEQIKNVSSFFFVIGALAVGVSLSILAVRSLP